MANDAVGIEFLHRHRRVAEIDRDNRDSGRFRDADVEFRIADHDRPVGHAAGNADRLGEVARIGLAVAKRVRPDDRGEAPAHVERVEKLARQAFELVGAHGERPAGRGEAVGVNYRGETAKTIAAQIEEHRAAIEAGLTRDTLLDLLPAGGARNAVDCALWDLECKRTGKSIWELTGVEPGPVTTAYTIVVADPHQMYVAASDARETLLKVKVTAGAAIDQVKAVREARADARLIVDGNQDFDLAGLEAFLKGIEGLGIELVEQPLPAGADAALEAFSSPIPLCADESFQTLDDLDAVAGRYSYASVKLDKTGGLTAGLEAARAVEAAGLGLMTGCWAATSLSMAPAFVIARFSAFADIDGPLLLKRDCDRGLTYHRGVVSPPKPDFWG